jgi:uncharacterized membrane protein (DUF106 family)
MFTFLLSKKTQTSRTKAAQQNNFNTKQREFRNLLALREQLLIKHDKANKNYKNALSEHQDISNSLSPYSNSTEFAKQIIIFSAILGALFDLLLWVNIFDNKFGQGYWANSAEKASAIVLTFAYAFVATMLGVSKEERRVISNRDVDLQTNPKEQAIFNSLKDSSPVWLILFTGISLISAAFRFTQSGTLFEHTLLSSLGVIVGLVISTIAYHFHDIYDSHIKASKNNLNKFEKVFEKLDDQKNKLDLKIKDFQSLVEDLQTYTFGKPKKEKTLNEQE